MLNLGNVDASFALFLTFPPTTDGHISEREAWRKKYILTRSPSGIWLLVDNQKPHIRALLAEIRTVDCRGVLLICI